MKILKSTGAPRSKRTRSMALVAVSMLLVMLLMQLFGYEDFSTVLAGVLPVNDLPLTTLLAAAIVLAEMLALPYLLGMYIGTLMRLLSALLGFSVSGFWLLTCLTNAHANNSGLFSTTVDLGGGALAALWALVIFGLVVGVITADSKFRHDQVT